MSLKGLRAKYNLTQDEAASIAGVPTRTFRRYELDDEYGDNMKRQMIINSIEKKNEINEEKGLLTVETIKENLSKLFDEKYKSEIDFCYLFGSYAKGTAKENSDVDLYVSSNLEGLKFVGLIERIRTILHKNVDVIRSSELVNNIDLTNEIMKDGIKIYG